MKKLWGYIVAGFGILLGLLFLENKKRKEVEANLENSNLKADDRVLESKQKETEAKTHTQQEEIDKLKKDHDKATKENQKNLPSSEVEEYWKRRNNS